MKFRKGHPKPAGSGRKKGTPNKRHLPRVEELLAERGVNPVEKILELVPRLAPPDQLAAWKILASYVFVKPQGDDLPPPDPNTPSVAEVLASISGLTPDQALQLIPHAIPPGKKSTGSGLQ